MKIAYIYVLLKNSSVGVLKKIKEQEEALNQLHDDKVEIILFNFEKEVFNGRVRYVRYFYKKNPLLNHIFLLFAKYYLLQKSFDFSGYDKILLRYPGADISGPAFMKKNRNVFLEFHAKITDEFKSKIKDTKSIPKKLMRLFRFWQEKIFRTSILKRCSGIISMSDEISKYINSTLPQEVPAITISNGINIKKVTKTEFSNFDGKNLKIVFIGSRPESWHGLDRLIRSIKQYKKNNRDRNIELHFIGNIKPNDLSLSVSETADSLYFHGLKYDKELDKVMAKMNLAVCQLSLYKKNLNELSTLKTCEYITRGIPFILAYNDPNLYGVNKNFKFYKKFPNDDSIIDLHEVFSFMNSMQANKKEILKYMKKYAEENIDWTKKLREYIDFINL